MPDYVRWVDMWKLAGGLGAIALALAGSWCWTGIDSQHNLDLHIVGTAQWQVGVDDKLDAIQADLKTLHPPSNSRVAAMEK